MSKCGHFISMAGKIIESERTRCCVLQIVLPMPKSIMEMMTKLGGTLSCIKTTWMSPKGSNLDWIQSLDSAVILQEIQKTEEHIDLHWEHHVCSIQRIGKATVQVKPPKLFSKMERNERDLGRIYRLKGTLKTNQQWKRLLLGSVLFPDLGSGCLLITYWATHLICVFCVSGLLYNEKIWNLTSPESSFVPVTSLSETACLSHCPRL